MKKARYSPALTVALLWAAFLVLPSFNSAAQTPPRSLKALVGGTLIDGYGSKPIRNSVIIVEGERIKAVGQVGSLAIPNGAEGHLNRRHVRFARALGHARSPD